MTECQRQTLHQILNWQNYKFPSVQNFTSTGQMYCWIVD